MPALSSDWSVAGAAPWDVHRRWVTRLGRENFGRRMGRRMRDAPDVLSNGPDVGCIDGLDDLLIGVAVVVVVILLIVFVAPLVIFLVEALLLLVAVLLGLVARIVFRRPWSIDAFGADGTHLRWKAVGWRAATAKIDEVTAALSHGLIAPGAEVVHSNGITTQPPPEWNGTGPFGSGRPAG